jgi:xanthine/CO dehydrogenase XdhC/CoxF family maturation factor
MLLEHLKSTERHIARGREHVAHQRELIAELEHDGHATAARAKDILQSFLEIQALYESDRERILIALDHAQPPVIQPAASDGLTAEHCVARAEEGLARADRCRSPEAKSLGCWRPTIGSFLRGGALIEPVMSGIASPSALCAVRPALSHRYLEPGEPESGLSSGFSPTFAHGEQSEQPVVA